MKRIVYTFTLLISCIWNVHAGINEDFIKANRLYSQSNYLGATEIYLSILERGYESEVLYFNLGNACFEQDRIAKAILYFEKGLKIDPRDKSIQNNLRLARQRMNSDIGEIPDFFLKVYWINVSNLFTSTGWGSISIFFLFLIMISFAWWLLHMNPNIKKLSFYSACLFFGFLILSILFGTTKRYYETSENTAIVMVENTDLMSAADDRSEIKLRLTAGEKVVLLDQVNNWYKVELADKEQGWVLQQRVEKI